MQAWSVAGALAAEGRYGEAEALLRAVLQARPALAEAHSDLGLVQQRLGRLDQAEACYRRALQLEPALPAVHYNLGTLLRQQERLEEAILAFRQALALRPDYPQALNNLGNCLRRTGALAEAREALEKALALQPGLLEAHYNLAALKTYREGDPQIPALLGLERRLAGLPELSRIRYWFTRGKMLEDTRQFDQAFAAYQAGNALAKSRTPWDEAAEIRLHEALRARFTRAWFASRPPLPPETGPIPVFIVGMPRSGTSLLEQVLASCAGVHGAGELPFLGEVLREAAGGSPLPDALASATPEDLRALGRRYLDRLRQVAPAGATHVTDKMPGNFVHAGLIPLLLPGARIIHAMRNPMDSCLSCFTRHFQEGHLGYTYDLALLGRTYVRYITMMGHWQDALPPDRILDVRYEALVEDLEGQTRRLLAYLGLAWDPACLAFHENRRAVRTASAAQVQRPLYRSSVARWKAFEGHLGPLMEQVGDYR